MRPLTPRQVAGLLATPGCERRARLVGALEEAAVRAGARPPAQSPFALARTAQFARAVTADGQARLLELAEEQLGPGPWRVIPLPVPSGTVAGHDVTLADLPDHAVLHGAATPGGEPTHH